MRRIRWCAVVALVAIQLVGLGCAHTQPFPMGPIPGEGHAPIAVPPPGEVPVEMNKVTLPPYVIEAPDSLLIEVIQQGDFPVPDETDDSKSGFMTKKDKDGKARKDPVTQDWDFVKRPGTQRLPIQTVTGTFLVRSDGTVGLGFWGSVPVAGLTLDQAAAAIRQHLIQSKSLRDLGTKPESLIVIVDVLAYNSKRYYVVLDGGGYGEQVYPFPIYGSETVMDAIANVNGLHAVASKRNIWVARRTPHPGQPWQILPVDWIGMTQHGITVTNYQVMPGDRIYVKAQKIVTIDTALARVISPIERVLGVTLLGTSTVNQIKGRGNGFNNGF